MRNDKDQESLGHKANSSGAAPDTELALLEAEVGKALNGYTTRVPSLSDTEKLLAMLQPEFDLLKKSEDAETANFPPLLPVSLKRPSLLRQCLRLAGTYGKTYWLISAAVFVMLTLMSQGLGGSLMRVRDLFTLTVPLFMLICAAYSYRSWNEEMRQVESITPYPPALQLLSRLLIVITMNIAFGLAGSFYLRLMEERFRAADFLLPWLSELLLVGGVLAAVTFWKGTKAGFACGLCVWLLWNLGWNFYWSQHTVIMDGESSGEGILFAALAAGGLLIYAAYRQSLRIQWLKG